MGVRLPLVAIAALLLTMPLEAREPIGELPCEETEFADVTAVDCDFVEAFLDTDFGEVAGCELDRLRVSRHPTGFVIRARWRPCDTSTLVLDSRREPPNRLRLRLEVDRECRFLSGTLRGRGVRRPVGLVPVTAVEDECDAMLGDDDVVVDDGDEDEDVDDEDLEGDE
jgi:hypothetical protein